eukprot:13193465-Ditylum_brightwellii.AAC.1
MTIHNMGNSHKQGIEVLDERSKEVGLTLCQMIMEQTAKDGERFFILVAQLVYGSEVIFTFPKKYKTEAHTRMSAIGQYLEKKYGKTVR